MIMYWGNDGAAPCSYHADCSMKSTGRLYTVAVPLVANSWWGLCGVRTWKWAEKYTWKDKIFSEWEMIGCSIPDVVIGMFHWINFFWSHYNPGVDSACKRNVYRGYLLEGKGGRCVGLTTLPPSCADYLEILGAYNSWGPRAYPGL
jgi:hypothetical protein